MLLAAERGDPERGVGPRLRAVGRHQDVEDRRHRGDAGRGDRAARPRRAPVLPAPRGRLRGRRELQLGPVRRALHRRPGGRAGEPGVALAGDDREVPRGRGPAAAGTTPRSTRPDGRRSSAYARAMDAHDLRGGAEAAWDLVATANLYIQQVAPWKLAKEGREAELDVGPRGAGARALPARGAGGPVHPRKSGEHLGVAGRAGPAGGSRSGARSRHPRSSGLLTRRPETLFPKPASV